MRSLLQSLLPSLLVAAPIALAAMPAAQAQSFNYRVTPNQFRPGYTIYGPHGNTIYGPHGNTRLVPKDQNTYSWYNSYGSGTIRSLPNGNMRIQGWWY